MDKSIESPFPKLSSDEMLELERIYQDMGQQTLDMEFFQEIAKRFSSASNCAGKTSLSWQQVQQWFTNKQKESRDKVSSPPDMVKLFADLSGEKNADLSELAFEARSSKDFAWHDVSMFLNYRVVCTGELEVRVRYAGFGKEQDEWVKVKEGVRERSIPLVPSECHKVHNGDFILCFLEREDYALYCDARVVKIQRRPHDPVECRCNFVVQYVHDKSEEEVCWNRICRRPTQVESEAPLNLGPTHIPMLNPIENLWG